MQLVGQPAGWKHLNLDENSISYSEACQRCRKQKMQSSLDILRYLWPEQPFSRLVNSESENHDESFTSIQTNQSFEKKEGFYQKDKNLQFRFKKPAKVNESSVSLKDEL